MTQDPRYREPFADVDDRHVMREALGALERACERFRAIIPDVSISHVDARDLVADADHLAVQLNRLGYAHEKRQTAEWAARASRYLGVDVTVETVDAADLAARSPAFPTNNTDPSGTETET